MITLICIDPGIRGTGVALFEPKRKYPVRTYLCKASRVKTWEDRAYQICTRLEDIIYKNKPKMAIIEQPLFMRSRTGIASAAAGHLVKLSMLAGAFYWICSSNGLSISTVLPSVWKGRFKKEEVHARMRKYMPELPADEDHNVMDAIGIGLHYKSIMVAGRIVKGG